MQADASRGPIVSKSAWRGAALRFGRWASLALGAPLLASLVACGGGSGGGAAGVVAAATTDSGSTVASATPVVDTGSTTTATATPVVATDGGAVASGSIDPSLTASADASTTASGWTPCAAENQTCSFTGAKVVRYGIGTSYSYLTLSNGTPCTNAVFGDPASGIVKSCDYQALATAPTFPSSSWTLCAAENGTCTFVGSQWVRYGSLTKAATQQATGPVACNNSVFGDPASGIVKSCWVAAVTAVPSGMWTACAAEYQRCSFSGTRAVRYGTASAFVTATYTGGVDCGNAVFGDPAVGTVKSCSYSSVDTTVSVTTTAPSVSIPAVTAGVLGTPIQVAVTLLDANGAPITGSNVTWTIADPTIATLSATGLATPLHTGYTTVTATAGSKTATGVLTVRGTTPIPTRSQYVGNNLAPLAYYGSNFPFADMMKSGGGWGSVDDNYAFGAPFPTSNADGYPTSLAKGQHAVAPVAWNNTHYPAGDYTLLWDGDGTMSMAMNKVTIVSSAPGRMVVEPTDLTAPIWIRIETTNPANPIRNVRFLWPGTESTYTTQPFNPVYLAKIAPFSMARFMNWAQTNGSPLVEWADRPLPSNASYSSNKGVPVELMIDLANTLHVDPWFCIPHMASDDYVRQFATLLHARLDPTLRPHIEYSNEVWNTGFGQNAWAKSQSSAKGLALPSSMPSIFYAQRAVQIFKVMQAVYGTTDAHRLTRVIAGQSEWTQFLTDALASADTAANADVLAVAPYFLAESADNPANVTATLALTPSQIVDQWLVSIRGSIMSQMAANAALAAKYKLTMRAYESGPGDTVAYFPQANQSALVALFSAANASPRMKDVYTEFYTQWKAAGGDTMNQFLDVGSWSIYGFWGSVQFVTDDVTAAPKYQGLMSFISANPLTAQQTALKSTIAQ